MDGSAWWKDLVCICDGVGLEVGGWFMENVRREVGNGENTFFWTDMWSGDMSLRDRFQRLFDLKENKWLTVADILSLGWGEGGEASKSCRRLLA